MCLVQPGDPKEALDDSDRSAAVARLFRTVTVLRERHGASAVGAPRTPLSLPQL